MAAACDLMYVRYLSKLNYDQLLYTDTDSVIVYSNLNQPNHIQLSTSDLLGELKDEYEGLLASNPSWYLSESIAFGPKMYQLIFKDKRNGRVVKWEKTMKGISLKENLDMLALSKVHLYQNPVLDFCSILQFGNKSLYNSIDEVWRKMVPL